MGRPYPSHTSMHCLQAVLHAAYVDIGFSITTLNQPTANLQFANYEAPCSRVSFTPDNRSGH